MTKTQPSEAFTLLEGVRRFGLFDKSVLLDDQTMFPKGTILFYDKVEKHLPRGKTSKDDLVRAVRIVRYQLPSSDPFDVMPVCDVRCPTYILEDELKGRFHTGPPKK